MVDPPGWKPDDLGNGACAFDSRPLRMKIDGPCRWCGQEIHWCIECHRLEHVEKLVFYCPMRDERGEPTHHAEAQAPFV